MFPRRWYAHGIINRGIEWFYTISSGTQGSRGRFIPLFPTALHLRPTPTSLPNSCLDQGQEGSLSIVRSRNRHWIWRTWTLYVLLLLELVTGIIGLLIANNTYLRNNTWDVINWFCFILLNFSSYHRKWSVHNHPSTRFLNPSVTAHWLSLFLLPMSCGQL